MSMRLWEILPPVKEASITLSVATDYPQVAWHLAAGMFGGGSVAAPGGGASASSSGGGDEPPDKKGKWVD